MKRMKGLLALAAALCLAGAAWADSATWNADADGNWYDAGNWDPNTTYPNGPGQTATLGDVITGVREIVIDANKTITVGHVRFSNPQGIVYTITGDANGLLVFDGNGVDATVTIDANTAEPPPVTWPWNPPKEFETTGGLKIRLDSNLVLTNNNETHHSSFTSNDQLGEFIFGDGTADSIDLNGKTLTFDGNGSFCSGQITGTGDVVKEGTGMLGNAGSAYAWTGHMYVNEGTLRIWDTPLTVDATVADGGSAVYKAQYAQNNNFTISGDGHLITVGGGAGGVYIYGKGALCRLEWVDTSMNGTIHLAASSTIYTYYASTAAGDPQNGAASFTFNGPITGGPDANLIKDGNGFISLNAANTYAGDTIINAGWIEINGGNTGGGATFINNASEIVFKSGSMDNCNITIASGAKLAVKFIGPFPAGTGTLNYNILCDDGDLMDVDGTLDLRNLTLAVQRRGWQSLQEYVIADYSGGGTIVGGSFGVEDLPDGWTIDYDGTATYSNSIVLLVPPGLLGDVNGDGNVDNLDITPFVYALVNGEAAFDAQYLTGDYWAADCRTDGNIDNLDITPFVALIAGGGEAVPEPASAALLVFGLLAVVRRRRRR